MLRIALPNKGRLADEARELFEDAGLGVRTSNDRALVATLGSEYEAIFVRAQDIAEFVADGDVTRMRLTVRYESKEARDTATRSGMERGMMAGYDRLEKVLAEGASSASR